MCISVIRGRLALDLSLSLSLELNYILLILVYSNFMENLYYKEEAYKIIGACMNVHRELGQGFLEAVYQEALALEFTEQQIPFAKESKIDIYYKENILEQYYVADFICYNNIIVELKAVTNLEPTHTAQVLNYLKATDLGLGLLVNFGTSSLESKRLVF